MAVAVQSPSGGDETAPSDDGKDGRGGAPDARENTGPESGGGFKFPDDRGGALLMKLLPPPPTRPPLADAPPEPRRYAPSPALESPALPLPTDSAPLLRVPLNVKQPPPRPRVALDEAPPLGRDLQPPEIVVLPVDERVKQPSANVETPLALPILALPVADRLALEDATEESSGAAVVAARPTQRTQPAPYVRQTLPDPYENRRAAPKPTFADEPMPPVGAPRPPKP